MRFAGLHYDGQAAQPQAVTVWLTPDGRICIEGEGLHLLLAREQIVVSARIGNTRRSLRWEGGAQVQTDDNDAVDAMFPRHGWFERAVAGLERHWGAALVSVLVTAVAAWGFVVHGLPWLAERAAHRVPVVLEQGMGEQVLDLLDDGELSPSTLSKGRQRVLSAHFAELVRDLPGAEGYKLVFRDAASLGANAFALPGGTVVVTDALVEQLQDEAPIVAVLAHEIGHQQHRHVMQRVLQDSALVVVLAVLTGDMSAMSTVVVTVPTVLLQSGYSRRLESEADAFAFTLLHRHGRSPADFADAMERLDAENDRMDEVLTYVSSHPHSAERIAAARAAAIRR